CGEAGIHQPALPCHDHQFAAAFDHGKLARREAEAGSSRNARVTGIRELPSGVARRLHVLTAFAHAQRAAGVGHDVVRPASEADTIPPIIEAGNLRNWLTGLRINESDACWLRRDIGIDLAALNECPAL